MTPTARNGHQDETGSTNQPEVHNEDHLRSPNPFDSADETSNAEDIMNLTADNRVVSGPNVTSSAGRNGLMNYLEGE